MVEERDNDVLTGRDANGTYFGLEPLDWPSTPDV